MSTGLTFNDDVQVYLNSVDTANLISNSCYSVKKNALSDGCTFEIVFDNLKTTSAAAGDTIIACYSATLNKNAVMGNDGEKNTSHLEFSNNPNPGGEGSTGKTPDETVYAFTFKLEVIKVSDEVTPTFLPDAHFKLHNENNKWMKLGTNGEITWVDAEADATELVTGSDGTVTVERIKTGTYYLKETQAPATYEPLNGEVKVVITATYASENNAVSALSITTQYGSATNTDVGDVTEGEVEVTIENTKGHSLPATGGMGTTLFYVLGSVLMIGAAVLLVTKRRMSVK